MQVKHMLKVLKGIAPGCEIAIYLDGKVYAIEATDLEEATKDGPNRGPVYLCVNTPYGPAEQARLDAEDQ